MNKFITKVAKLFLGLAMAAGVGVAVGNNNKKSRTVYAGTSTFTVTFVTDSGDGTALEKDTEESSFIQSGADKVALDSVTKTWYAGSKGLKVGASSSSGTVVFNLDDTYSISNIRLHCANYSTNSSKKATFTVKAGTTSADATFTPSSTTLADHDFAFSTAVSAGAITIQTNKYGWVDEIVVTYNESTPTPSSATINSFNVTAPSAYIRNAAIALTDWTITPVLSDSTTPSSIASFLSVSPALSTATTGTHNVTITYDATNGPYKMSTGISNQISSSYTVNPIPDTALSFKSNSKTIAINDEITLENELNENEGDSTVTYAIQSGSSFVSLSNGVVTGTALGTAVIRATKGSLHADLTVVVSSVQTWSHSFSSKLDSYSGDKTLTGKTWNFEPSWKSTAASVQNVDGTKGQQFGTGSNPLSELVLSSSAFDAYSVIQEITIETSGASSINATLTVVVGSSTYKNGNNDSVSLTSSNTSYTFTGSASGDVTLTWTQSSSKAIYIKSISITYDSTEPTQGGLNLAWATGKGTYKNGNAAGSKIDLASDFTLYKATSNGTSFGSAITSGYTTYVKNGSNEYLSGGVWNDEQTAFSTGTDKIAFNGVVAGSYTLFVTTPKETEGVWTSNNITLTIVDKVAETVTMNTEVTKLTYVAYYDAFTPYSGTVNVSYNDGGSGNNHTPVIKYFNGANEVTIGNLLNSDNTFNVASDTTLTVKLFDTGDTTGENAFASYTLTIYASELAVADGNGSGAEYQSGATVALNPSVTFVYNNLAETDPIDSSLVDLYIKKKGATGDGTLYSGTLPEVEEAETYTITAKLKINPSMSDHYDIDIYNAVFNVDHSSAKKNYIFGESFSKENLVVTLTYGSASPTPISAANYSVVDENNNVIDVIKFIGSKEVTVKYLGYSESYTITSTNVGSSTSNVHDDIPGETVISNTPVPVSYSSNSEDGIVSGDGFDYTTVASNKTYKALINASTNIGKNNAFGNNVVGKIVLNMDVKIASAGAGFTFTLAGISGTTVSTTYLTTTSKVSPTTSKSSVEIVVDNIPASAEITGWKLTATKPDSGSNCEFYDLSVTYTPYVSGDPITYNATPGEQAIAFAVYFNSEIGGLCSEGGNTSETNINAIKAKWATLNTEYTNMVADSKDYFAGNLSQSDIARTIGMYEQIIRKYGQTNFIKDSNNALVVSASGVYLPLFALNSNNTNTVAIIVIISMASMTAIGGYFFLRKRKENN